MAAGHLMEEIYAKINLEKTGFLYIVEYWFTLFLITDTWCERKNYHFAISSSNSMSYWNGHRNFNCLFRN